MACGKTFDFLAFKRKKYSAAAATTTSEKQIIFTFAAKKMKARSATTQRPRDRQLTPNLVIVHLYTICMYVKWTGKTTIGFSFFCCE